MKREHRRILIDLLSLPTSPFNEQFVIDYIRRWAEKRPGLRLTADRYGNLRLELRRGPAKKSPPLVLVAHMDHPGFEADRMPSSRRLRAWWRGGVPPEYFRSAGVRFYCDGKWVRGTITNTKIARDERGRRRVQSATVQTRGPVAAGSIGMWDLPDPVIRGSRLYARGCDDIAGVAAILAAFDELSRRPKEVKRGIEARFTRAEEVGFAGALALCRGNALPRQTRVISIECSSELAGVRMGQGPILRVGDWATIFNPELSAFCRAVAEDLAKRNPRFKFQRKLMDGGTCEASAFLGHGLPAGGLCIALGNYHNIDRRRHRIVPEFIDLRDWEGTHRLVRRARPHEAAIHRGRH